MPAHLPAPACRTCGSTRTAHLGRLPDVRDFAGAPLPAALPGGDLHACSDCGFVFRHPVLSDAQYLALYAQGSAAVWEQDGGREDFRLVRAEIGDTTAEVLDVGCYTGHLLGTLPAGCTLHGVEPSASAAAIAASRGINIVAGHWHELAAADRQYDVVIACDVIEHVADPAAFLQTLAARLRPSGRLIITTGNAQAWPWRLARSQFWYAYFPEHISFIGPRWLSRTSPQAGLRVARLQPFAHSPLPGMAARARALLVTCLGRLSGPAAPARLLGGGIARDHLFCVLRKD